MSQNRYGPYGQPMKLKGLYSVIQGLFCAIISSFSAAYEQYNLTHSYVNLPVRFSSCFTKSRFFPSWPSYARVIHVDLHHMNFVSRYKKWLARPHHSRYLSEFRVSNYRSSHHLASQKSCLNNLNFVWRKILMVGLHFFWGPKTYITFSKHNTQLCSFSYLIKSDLDDKEAILLPQYL